MREVAFHTRQMGNLIYVSFSIPKNYPTGKELSKKDAEEYIEQYYGFKVIHWMEF